MNRVLDSRYPTLDVHALMGPSSMDAEWHDVLAALPKGWIVQIEPMGDGRYQVGVGKGDATHWVEPNESLAAAFHDLRVALRGVWREST